jgi:hypothetical protein
MINHLNKNYRKTYLFISEGPEGFIIQPGNVSDPKAFDSKHSIVVSGDKPNVLWDLLHDLVGLPYPKLQPLKIEPPILIKNPVSNSVSTDDLTEITSLEKELMSLSSKDIIEKVKSEKGIAITISLKSKKSIIKMALKIYGEKR